MNIWTGSKTICDHCRRNFTEGQFILQAGEKVFHTVDDPRDTAEQDCAAMEAMQKRKPISGNTYIYKNK